MDKKIKIQKKNLSKPIVKLHGLSISKKASIKKSNTVAKNVKHQSVTVLPINSNKKKIEKKSVEKNSPIEKKSLLKSSPDKKKKKIEISDKMKDKKVDFKKKAVMVQEELFKKKLIPSLPLKQEKTVHKILNKDVIKLIHKPLKNEKQDKTIQSITKDVSKKSVEPPNTKKESNILDKRLDSITSIKKSSQNDTTKKGINQPIRVNKSPSNHKIVKISKKILPSKESEKKREKIIKEVEKKIETEVKPVVIKSHVKDIFPTKKIDQKKQQHSKDKKKSL